MSDLTEDEQRAVARFIVDVWTHERKWLRRRPTHDQTVVAAYAVAVALVDSEIGNRFRYLGAPRHVRSALQGVSSGVAGFSRRLTDTAAHVVSFLDEAGDSATTKAESIAKDRRVLALAAADHHRHGEYSTSAIGRAVGISHTSVRDRLLARSARIMERLHDVAPDLWSADGRPTTNPDAATGKVLLPLAA